METNTGQGFHYTGQSSPATPPVQQNTKHLPEEKSLIQWQASEFVNHEKGAQWFLMLGLGAVVLCIAMYFLTGGSIFSTIVAAVAVITFGVMAKQKPRTLSYSLLPTTLKIGERSYSYDDFRAFSVVKDGALTSILLQPNKRFMPNISIYFAPHDGEKIFDVLSVHLPYEERKLDGVEQLMRKIRF